MSNQKQRVIEALTNRGVALQQCEISDYTGDPAASIRRTVKELLAEGKVVIKDTNGWPGYAPRFVIAPAPAAQA